MKTIRSTILILMLVSPAGRASNMSTLDKYAWSENAGWLDFRPTHGGVTVHEDGANGYLSGFAWAENAGWVKMGADAGGPYANMGASDWGVNMDASGNLSGYAWSEVSGWINFNPAHSQVTVNAAGEFDGYAWSEGLGWIRFRNVSVPYGVVWIPPSAPPPSAPMATAGWALTTSGFQAKWVPSAGATHYVVDVATDAMFTTFLPGYHNRTVTDATALSVSGASPNQTLYYRVRAVNSSGESAPSTAVLVPLPPAVPATIVEVTPEMESATVEWDSGPGVVYEVYESQSPFRAGMPWTRTRTVTAAVERVSVPAGLGPRWFYQVVPSGMSPGMAGSWGIIQPEAKPGYTLMSPPLVMDRGFDGELGGALAEALAGHNGGVGAGGDEIMVLQPDGQWRMLYLDAAGLWREADGARSTYELPEGCGFFVARHAGAGTRIPFRGPVGNDGLGTVAIRPGWNLIGISEGRSLRIREAFESLSPKGAASEEEADLLVFQLPDGAWRRLMRVQGWGAPYDGNWFDLRTFTVVGPDDFIEPGTAYYYYRKGGPGELVF